MLSQVVVRETAKSAELPISEEVRTMSVMLLYSLSVLHSSGAYCAVGKGYHMVT